MFDIETETALFYGFIALFILVISTLIFLLIHAGFFIEINVNTCRPSIGQIHIAYKSARGPYKECGTLFTEVHSLLPQYRTLGVYYDDPKKKEPTRLRYIVGIVLSENDEPVKEDDLVLLKKWDYKFATFPSIQHAVQTSFPFKSTLSVIIGIFRVYPILDEYIEMRGLCAHPFIEVYDNEKGEIIFIGPLEKQDSFYVPEILEEERLEMVDDDDDRSSVSWDDSASYIKNEGFDSDSVAEDASSLCVDDSSLLNDDEKGEGDQDLLKGVSEPPHHGEHGIEESNPSPTGEESDNTTGSSFEEIDEKDTPLAPELEKDQPSETTLVPPAPEQD